MKLSYKDQSQPDADDHVLKAMVDSGVVPQGCMLGGPVVAGLNDHGQDPCATCDFDRERCGGRKRRQEAAPRTPASQHKGHSVFDPQGNDGAAARRELRALAVRRLSMICQDEP